LQINIENHIYKIDHPFVICKIYHLSVYENTAVFLFSYVIFLWNHPRPLTLQTYALDTVCTYPGVVIPSFGTGYDMTAPIVVVLE
jgi:hypothetical protein